MGVRTEAPLMRNVTLAASGDWEPVVHEDDDCYPNLQGTLRFQVNDHVSAVASSEAAYERIPVPGKKRKNTESSMRLSFRI